LVALAITGRIWARDVGRERDVADAIESGEEIVHALDHAVNGGLKADKAFAELGAGQDFGLQFVLRSEEEAFTDSDFAAGANQAFPIVGIGGELAGKENFNTAVEEITRRWIARADSLSANAFSATVEASRKDAGIVEDHEIAGMQQVGEVAEQAIGITAAGALQVQHARRVAGGEGFLGDEFVGKVEVKIGNQHGVRL
jgi:hypothetical protein